MKQFSLSFILLACFHIAQAKKVKFAVDMAGQTINVTGVHVMGDFQQLAGFGADWTPGTTTLTQEGNTTIYSIIVNLPAFRKYEFRFLNGDQTYEAEYVPEKCRVDEFNDNRWMYVDSLSNDTSFLGAIVFANSSPAGKTLLRYKIDMRAAGALSPNGIHVGNSYQSTAFSPTARRMCSIATGIYEIIDYVNTGTYAYIYYNGNTLNTAESVPSACAVNARRTIVLSSDTVLDPICFSSCSACVGVGIASYVSTLQGFNFYPNPSSGVMNIDSPAATTLTISNTQGQVIARHQISEGTSTIVIEDLPVGLYFICTEGSTTALKFVRQ